MSRLTSIGPIKVGLVQFPGSNCDMDCIHALKRYFGIQAFAVWHTETQLPPTDALIIPGGFSFGDYLRSGALASHSRIMPAVKSFIDRGGAVMGICNGFQILTESRLLPGALLRNSGRSFICKQVQLGVMPGSSHFQRISQNESLCIPIAHGEGRYYADTDTYKSLCDHNQIAYRYVDSSGQPTATANPNGSLENIAGIVSRNGRVLGLMPHPERAVDRLTGGSADGLKIIEAFLNSSQRI